MEAMVVYQWANEGEWIYDIQGDVENVRQLGWEVGDKLRCGIEQFGRGNRERITQLYRAMSEHTGLAIGTLYNWTSVAKRFPPEKRNASLTVSHHIALLGVDDDLQDYLLSEAEARGMSVGRLRAMAHLSHDDMRRQNQGVSATEVDNGEGEFAGQSYLDPATGEELPLGDELPVSEQPDYDGDEWYTPSEYIELAREVMGRIDLDPASCPAAQEIVRATTYWTKFDDALRNDLRWYHRVWLNPPYSFPLIEQFVDKLIRQYELGFIEAAIIVVNNSTDTAWFHSLASRYPFCLLRGRIPFWHPVKENSGTRQGQVFFYLGLNSAKFVEVFSRVGTVVNHV